MSWPFIKLHDWLRCVGAKEHKEAIDAANVVRLSKQAMDQVQVWLYPGKLQA